jgi:hypothetical protein
MLLIVLNTVNPAGRYNPYIDGLHLFSTYYRQVKSELDRIAAEQVRIAAEQARAAREAEEKARLDKLSEEASQLPSNEVNVEAVEVEKGVYTKPTKKSSKKKPVIELESVTLPEAPPLEVLQQTAHA